MTYREWLKDRRDEHIDPCRAYNSGYNIAVKYMATLIEPLKADSYEKGKQAERERIKDIICEVTGGFGNCDRLMEKIDDVY